MRMLAWAQVSGKKLITPTAHTIEGGRRNRIAMTGSRAASMIASNQ